MLSSKISFLKFSTLSLPVNLPFGTDPLNAETFALELASRLGGVVHPALYMGTEVARRKEEKEWFGLKNTDEEIIGMDMPGFTVKSLYWSPEVFELAAHEVLHQLKRAGFRVIVVINGHGAQRQYSILKAAAQRLSDTNTKILYVFPFWVKQRELRVSDGEC